MTRSLWKTKIKKPLSIREGGNTGLVASGANREKDCKPKCRWNWFQILSVDLTIIFLDYGEKEKFKGACARADSEEGLVEVVSKTSNAGDEGELSKLAQFCNTDVGSPVEKSKIW